MEYDVHSSLLFDDEMMTKPNKSLLLKELESYLSPDDYSYSNCSNASFIVDVMAIIRKVNLTNHSNFGDMMDNFISFMGIFHQLSRCDYVFDMYSEELSIKDSERKIEYNPINKRLNLSKDMKMLWPSRNNKLLLEKLIYQHLSSTDFMVTIPLYLDKYRKKKKGMHHV